MVPSVGRGEEMGTSGKSKSPPHRYYTRSSRDQESRREYRYPNDERTSPRKTHQTARKPNQLPIRHCPPPSDNAMQNEKDNDAQEIAAQQESMMDQITYASTSNPIRAPFPSPAIKSTQPFCAFPPTQQNHGNSYSEGAWGTQETSWRQGGGGSSGQCILLEAAKRAQMAILVDDMGMMGLEQMEQT